MTLSITTRERVTATLSQALSHAITNVKECDETAERLENAVMTYSCQNYSVYECKAKQVIYALTTNVVDLLSKYPVTALVALDDSQLHEHSEFRSYNGPQQSVTLKEAVQKFDELHGDDNDAGDAVNVCRKCHSEDLSFDMKQVRSADEPMTVFWCCRKCGNAWKT